MAELSHTLNRLASALGLAAGDERFRNEAGAYMKLMNFLPHDPLYEGVGLRSGGRLDGEIWIEFADNPRKLSRAANGIRRHLDEGPAAERSAPGTARLEAVRLLAEDDISRRGLKSPRTRLLGLNSVTSLIRQVLPEARTDSSRLRGWSKPELVARLQQAKGKRLNGAEASALNTLLSHIPVEDGQDWRQVVLQALRRYAKRNRTRKIRREDLLRQELKRIVGETSSLGATPAQTVSRVLQELRDDGAVYFLGRGTYLLLDPPLDVEAEDVPDRALDFAAKRNRLRIGAVATSDETALARRRKGQDRVRALTLQNYGGQCALCDISDVRLLVASHVSSWADDPENRGNLSNVICLCRFHDALFENGYLAFSDDLAVLRGDAGGSKAVESILSSALEFRPPLEHPPDPTFLRRHRRRWGHRR